MRREPWPRLESWSRSSRSSPNGRPSSSSSTSGGSFEELDQTQVLSDRLVPHRPEGVAEVAQVQDRPGSSESPLRLLDYNYVLLVPPRVLDRQPAG